MHLLQVLAEELLVDARQVAADAVEARRLHAVLALVLDDHLLRRGAERAHAALERLLVGVTALEVPLQITLVEEALVAHAALVLAAVVVRVVVELVATRVRQQLELLATTFARVHRPAATSVLIQVMSSQQNKSLEYLQEKQFQYSDNMTRPTGH